MAAIVVPSCLPLRDAVKDGPGIDGVYVVNGTDTVGNEYSGNVDVRTSDDGTVQVQWMITGGIQEGTGSLDGDVLEVDWHTVTDPRGTSSGSAEFVVADDGTVAGTRTIDGVDGTASEEWFLRP